MLHMVDLTGDYNTTIYQAARKLADSAGLEDIIETHRNGKLSMRGIVGKAAKATVQENKLGNPSLMLRRWAPFPVRGGQKMPSDEF
jgi:hypothetical protein